jgi:hypothetical protein
LLRVKVRTCGERWISTKGVGLDMAGKLYMEVGGGLLGARRRKKKRFHHREHRGATESAEKSGPESGSNMVFEVMVEVELHVAEGDAGILQVA